MWERFLEGCLDGLAFIIVVIIILVVALLCGLPIALALMYCNGLWLLLYLIIVPIGFGVYNVIDSVPA